MSDSSACASLFFLFFCGAAGREFPSFSFLRPFFVFWLFWPFALPKHFRVPAFSAVFVLCGPSTSRKSRRGNNRDSFFFQKKKKKGADIVSVTSFIHSEERYPRTHTTHTNKKKKKEEKRSGERGERETSLNLARITFFCLIYIVATTTRAEKEERVCISRRPTASLRF
jgi:hypothetical protein